MAGDGDQEGWTQGWPAATERQELWDGRLVFELRGFHKSAWTDDDVAAAERCYVGQRVTLSDSRALMFVDPPRSRRTSPPVTARAPQPAGAG